MPICSVQQCNHEAQFEVILYDVYLFEGTVFFEQDYTCPYICVDHLRENEEGIVGTRELRGTPDYPHTNQHGAQGFSIYRPIDTE